MKMKKQTTQKKAALIAAGMLALAMVMAGCGEKADTGSADESSQQAASSSQAPTSSQAAVATSPNLQTPQVYDSTTPNLQTYSYVSTDSDLQTNP